MVLRVRMSYDSYDGDGFIGLADAGSTVTATFSGEEVSDPPGCEWSRGTSTGSLTTPSAAGFSGWKDDLGLIVAPGVTVTVPVTTTSTLITGVPGNCTTSSDSSSYDRSMGIPDGVPAGKLSGHTVNYNYTHTDSGGGTTYRNTISGSLTFGG